MRVLTPLELLTAILYGYLGTALPWNSTFSIVQGLHFVVVCLAGIAIGVGAWQRARWVPKAAVFLAAICQLLVLILALQSLEERKA